MALPTYAAEASLYRASRSYRGARGRPVADAGTTVIAQQDPCAIAGGGGGGGGGGGPIPHRCADNERCCEPVGVGGLCFRCVPRDAQCE
jgi:hypothetical protein